MHGAGAAGAGVFRGAGIITRPTTTMGTGLATTIQATPTGRTTTGPRTRTTTRRGGTAITTRRAGTTATTIRPTAGTTTGDREWSPCRTTATKGSVIVRAGSVSDGRPSLTLPA